MSVTRVSCRNTSVFLVLPVHFFVYPFKPGCYSHITPLTEYTVCIKMIVAVWKLIIFTSMVNGIINTSSNERIILHVYDTCLQMSNVCTLGHTAHIEAIVQFLPHSDQHVRCDGPALFPLQRHPVV